MASIFADDSSLEDQRAAVANEMIGTLPMAYRIPMRGMIEKMVADADAETVARMRTDLRDGFAAAQRGDMDAMLQIARHWASDEQIAAMMPSVESMLTAKQ